MDDSAPGPVPASAARGLLPWVGLALMTAATGWLLGHLPWVVSGFSWPTTEAAPIGSSSEGLAGVRLTIPLVAAYLPFLVAFTLVGAAAAMLLPLVLTTRASGHRWPAIAVSAASLVVVMTVITVLARASIETHAADAFAGDRRVLTGLVLVVAGATVVGGSLGALASAQVGFAPLVAALVAGQAQGWLDGFLVDTDAGVDAVRRVGQAADLVTLVILAVAFGLSVRRSLAWMALWPVAVAVFWVATPARVATIWLAGHLRPSAGLPDTLPDILDGALDVFRAAFWEAPQARWPWVVALLVGVLWAAVDRRRAAAPG